MIHSYKLLILRVPDDFCRGNKEIKFQWEKNMALQGVPNGSFSLSVVLPFLILFLHKAESSPRELEGLELRCCAVVEYPILYEDETEQVGAFQLRLRHFH